MPAPLIPLIIGAAAGGISSLVGSGIAANNANKINQANIQSQRELLDWQKGAQYTTWAREDNAVRRRVNDMRRAGISPHAAAGGAAQSSGPVGMKAPQGDATLPIKNQANMQATINSFANIAQTLAQTQVLNATGQIKSHEADIVGSTKNYTIDSAKSASESAAAQAKYDVKIVDNRIKLMEQSLEQINLSNQFTRRTMTMEIARKAHQLDITKAEAQNIVRVIESKLATESTARAKASKSIELSTAQINRITELLPEELNLLKNKNNMMSLKETDFSKLPPRVRTVIGFIMNALKMIF